MNRYAIKKLKPDPLSVAARLPQVYLNFRKELEKTPAPVHYIPNPNKWQIHKYLGKINPVVNVPIPMKFPKEADEGIWGGEGVIKGFTKKNKIRRRHPTFWIPELRREVIYSEILNKYMSVTVTERTMRLIDKHFGFDNYILETPVEDLKSQLAVDLRRTFLLALINKERFYDSDKEQVQVWNKYEKFKIPREQAEWFGLTMRAAIIKQRLLEDAEKAIPLKHHLRKLFIENLKEKEASGQLTTTQSSWKDKLPFIGRKEKVSASN